MSLFCFIIISMVINFLWVSGFNLWTLEKIDNTDSNKKKSSFEFLVNSVKGLLNFLFSFINFDYVASKFSKKFIEYKGKDNSKSVKERRTDYIKHKNKYNLITSIAVLVLIFILLLASGNISKFNFTNIDFKISFLYVFLFIRLLSRALEIIFAFYYDISKKEGLEDEQDNENKSNLNSSDRFKLAVRSLFEIIIRCATIYLLLHIIEYGRAENFKSLIGNTFSSLYMSIINSINFASIYSSEDIFNSVDIYHANVYGSIDVNNSTSAFKGTYTLESAKNVPYIYTFIRKTTVVIQAVSSFVLIILSFAKYLSSKEDEKSKKNQEDEKNKK